MQVNLSEKQPSASGEQSSLAQSRHKCQCHRQKENSSHARQTRDGPAYPFGIPSDQGATGLVQKERLDNEEDDSDRQSQSRFRETDRREN